MELKPEYIFWAIFAAVIFSFLFKMAKNGSFKAAMFGARIKNTVGEVSGASSKMMNLKLKVHELDDITNERAVGLELVEKSFASYQMMPITLSLTEAKKLADILNQVTYGR